MSSKKIKKILMSIALTTLGLGVFISVKNMKAASVKSASEERSTFITNKIQAANDSGQAIYNITGRNSVSTEGETPENSTATFENSERVFNGDGTRIGGGNHQLLTLNNYESVTITGITVTAKDALLFKSRGRLQYSVDGGDFIDIIPNGSFSDWYGSSSSSYVDISRSMNIDVTNTISFRIEITTGNFHNSAYKVSWQKQIPPLEALEINRSELSLFEGQEFELSVTPVPSNADGNVTWLSSDDSIASVSSNGVVKALAPGNVDITATSIENVNITATCSLIVTEALIFQKVLNRDSLRFGATYTVGSANTEGMVFDENYINQNQTIQRYDAQFTDDNRGIYIEDVTLKFTLEPGSIVETYSLKIFNEDKYINIEGGGISLVSEKNSSAFWEISFNDGNGDGVTIKSLVDGIYKQLKFSESRQFFGVFDADISIMEQAIDLYVDEGSLTKENEVNSVTRDILYGNGNNASGECASRYEVIDWAVNNMTSEAQNAFFNSTDPDTLSALEHINYINEWLDLNREPSLFNNLINTSDPTNNALFIISLLGLGTIAGYFVVIKRPRRKRN